MDYVRSGIEGIKAIVPEKYRSQAKQIRAERHFESQLEKYSNKFTNKLSKIHEGKQVLKFLKKNFGIKMKVEAFNLAYLFNVFK